MSQPRTVSQLAQTAEETLVWAEQPIPVHLSQLKSLKSSSFSFVPLRTRLLTLPYMLISGQKHLAKKHYDVFNIHRFSLPFLHSPNFSQDAFIAFVQHQKLATDWLPNRHSLYYNVPEESIVTVQKVPHPSLFAAAFH